MENYKEIENLKFELLIKENEQEKLFLYIKNDKNYDKDTLSILINHYTELKEKINELRNKIQNYKNSMATKKFDIVNQQKKPLNKKKQYDIKNDPIMLFNTMNKITELTKNVDVFLHMNKKINFSHTNYTTVKKAMLRNSECLLKKIDLLYENYKHLSIDDFEKVLQFTFDK